MLERLKKNPSQLRRTAAHAALLLAFVAPLAAQSDATRISGLVQDPQGNGVGAAQVSLRNETTHTAQHLIADREGHFATPALAPGQYTLEIVATGFAVNRRTLTVTDHAENLTVPLAIDSANEQITVEADRTGSVAAQYAPMDGLLEARSARTEISNSFIQNFTAPTSDFSEIIQMAPGTFSVNANGVGLGDSKDLLPRLFGWQLRHHLRRHSV